jgi:hypothetical protein
MGPPPPPPAFACFVVVLLQALTVAACGVSGHGRDPGGAGEPVDAAAGIQNTRDGDRVFVRGELVPPEKVVVFLHIGHSNMAGRTTTPVALRPFNYETHPQLWAVNPAGVWRPAREPLSGDFLTQGRSGPGMSILRTALDMAPAATIVSIGHGHDGSQGGRCSSFRRGGLLYDIVMAPAKQLAGKVTFGGILSMLVLMEAFVDKTQLHTSHLCYEGLAADMREDLGDPDIPFLMSDWEMGATGIFRPTSPDAVVAREQLRVAQRNIPRSAIIPTDGLPMSDNHHFNLQGYKMWAERAFAIVREAGWAPWVAANQPTPDAAPDDADAAADAGDAGR